MVAHPVDGPGAGFTRVAAPARPRCPATWDDARTHASAWPPVASPPGPGGTVPVAEDGPLR